MAELELDLHLRTLMHYLIGQALCKLPQLFLNKVVFKVSFDVAFNFYFGQISIIDRKVGEVPKTFENVLLFNKS